MAAAAQRRLIPCLVLVLIAMQLLLTISASAQSFDPPTDDDQSGNSNDTSAPVTTDTTSSNTNYTNTDIVQVLNQVLNASGKFNIFLSIAGTANFTSTLQAFINSTNTSNATAFIPLDSAFNTTITSAFRNLSTANQTKLLLYHVLPSYYNRSQVVTLSNVTTVPAVLNNITAGYRLTAVNQSSDGVITVYASRNAANVSNDNISGISNPPTVPIAIYPIHSLLLPTEIDIFASTSNSSNKTSSPAPAPSASAATSISTISIMSLLLIFGAIALY